MSLTMVMTIFGLRLYLHPQNFCLFTSQSILQSYNFLMEVILGNHYQAMGCRVDLRIIMTNVDLHHWTAMFFYFILFKIE